MREFDEDDATASPYSRKVGERLRVIRRQSSRWSINSPPPDGGSILMPSD